jgi:peptide/nickel transport system permease protein
VALGSVLVAGAIGVPLGLIAGYAAGKIDSVIMRVLDAILAFPVILLAILVVATLGTQTINLILTIGFVFIPYFTRLVRGNVLTLKEREFVAASRASGADDGYLVTRVILPNILSPIVVQASLTMSLAVLIEAALSFLGLGVQEPTPAWGSMLQNSQLYLHEAPWFVFSPGICIFVSVLAFNLIGDGLRDLLDVSGRRR